MVTKSASSVHRGAELSIVITSLCGEKTGETHKINANPKIGQFKTQGAPIDFIRTKRTTHEARNSIIKTFFGASKSGKVKSVNEINTTSQAEAPRCAIA